MPFGDVFENAWDCDHCGTKGISALKHKTCPVCGAAASGPDKEYIADVNHLLTDFDDLQLADEVPDWTCRFCQTRNRADKTECSQCGNNRSEADQTAYTIDYGAAAPTTAPITPFEGQSAIKYKPNPARRGIIGAIVAVLVVLFGLGAFALLHKPSIQGQVIGFSWTRQVNIDLYETVQRQGRSVPSGGRVTSSMQVIDHYDNTYKTVHVSKTCYKNNGNGSSKSYDCGYNQQVLVSSRPVYAAEYFYNIDVWQPARKVNAAGDDHYAHWPEYVLASGQAIGSERVGSQDESYTVKFADSSGKNQYTLTTSLQNWGQYPLGAWYSLVLDFRNAVINDPLNPQNTSPGPTATPTSTPTETAEPSGPDTLTF